MPTEAKATKYWVYAHDALGFIETLGEVETIEEALPLVAEALGDQPIDEARTIRIVDNDSDTTIWAAGPVTHVEGQATI